jgi:hypothetical protein
VRWLVLVLALGCADCAARRPSRVDMGIPRCPAGADTDFLTADSLQCWFDGPGGRWRIVDLGSHLQALVVDVRVARLSDTDVITEQFAANHRRDYAEIVVYGRTEPWSPSVRRARWTAAGGVEALEFPGP